MGTEFISRAYGVILATDLYDLCLHIGVNKYLIVCFMLFQEDKILKRVSSFFVIIDIVGLNM